MTSIHLTDDSSNSKHQCLYISQKIEQLLHKECKSFVLKYFKPPSGNFIITRETDKRTKTRVTLRHLSRKSMSWVATKKCSGLLSPIILIMQFKALSFSSWSHLPEIRVVNVQTEIYCHDQRDYTISIKSRWTFIFFRNTSQILYLLNDQS